MKYLLIGAAVALGGIGLIGYVAGKKIKSVIDEANELSCFCEECEDCDKMDCDFYDERVRQRYYANRDRLASIYQRAGLGTYREGLERFRTVAPLPHCPYRYHNDDDFEGGFGDSPSSIDIESDGSGKPKEAVPEDSEVHIYHDGKDITHKWDTPSDLSSAKISEEAKAAMQMEEQAPGCEPLKGGTVPDSSELPGKSTTHHPLKDIACKGAHMARDFAHVGARIVSGAVEGALQAYDDFKTHDVEESDKYSQDSDD